MNILCVSPHIPWPLHGGPQLRIFHTLRLLHDAGHEVTLLAGSGSDTSVPLEVEQITSAVHKFTTASGSRRRTLGASLLSPRPYPSLRFATEDYRDTLSALLSDQRWDIILVNHLIMAEDLVKVTDGDAPVVLDQHESDVEIWQEYRRHGAFHERIFAHWNLCKVVNLRRRLLPELSGVICVADEEVNELRHQLNEAAALVTAPNGVDIEAFNPADHPPMVDRPKNIIFCAGMGVERNVKAARWFADEVFPIVQAQVPEATFTIVGSQPPPEIQALSNHAGLEVTGTVPRVQPYYGQARVTVIPNLHGGFSKLKLSEAMAMGLPIVSTPSGAKGAPAGSNLINTAVAPDRFAGHVVQYLEDAHLASKVGQEARAIAEAHLSWERTLSCICPALEDLAGQ